MAVQSEIFSTNYGVRSFASTKHIGQKQNMAVWLQRRSDNLWVQLSQSNYELINNSAVLTTAPNATTYSQVEIRVADTPDELGSSQSEISIVAGLYDEIVALNGIKNDITTVADTSVDVTTVSSNILDINSVVTNIVPNLAEILQADTNATIATTKATEASASATSASTSATTATNQATIATTKASEASASATSASNSATTATTKASEALASATSASNSATSASNSATTATTKANEASASASSALTSANNANTSETMAYKWSSNPVDTIVETDKYSAFHWATKAQQYASSVDPSNLVHKNGDETIAGVKTFSNTIVGNISGTSTKLNNSANDWSASGAIGSVVGMLAWKNYNNGHVIFDASNSTSPTGSAVNNTNSTSPWSPNYPSLMGWNGTQTFGLRVDSARVADAFSTTSGSAPSYACRAWVNFNGTGTVEIRASGNVSSITDNGTGDYTVNFTTVMPDADYNYTFGLRTYQDGYAGFAPAAMQWLSDTQSTSAMRFRTMDSNQPSVNRGFPTVCVSIHR